MSAPVSDQALAPRHTQTAASLPFALVRHQSAPGAQCVDESALLGGLCFGAGAGAPAGAIVPIALPLLPAPALTTLSDCWPALGPMSAGRVGNAYWRGDGTHLFAHVQCSQAPGEESDLRAATARCYDDLLALCQAQNYTHILRFWNYIPRINDVEQGLERYRQFNIGRHEAFARARTHAAHSAPAACALGTQGASLSILMLAARAPAVVLENPRQMSAFHYPAEHGPKQPIFSRACLYAATTDVHLFISGTASIVGHHSQHVGDVGAQVDETMRNLSAVLAVANEQKSMPSLFSLAQLALLVYVRHADDLPLVKQRLGAWQVPSAQLHFLQADICRADLLVEIEAYARAPGAVVAGTVESA